MRKVFDIIEWISLVLSMLAAVFAGTWIMLKVMDILIWFNTPNFVSGIVLVLTWIFTVGVLFVFLVALLGMIIDAYEETYQDKVRKRL